MVLTVVLVDDQCIFMTDSSITQYNLGKKALKLARLNCLKTLV